MDETDLIYHVKPTTLIHGDILLPGDKSISHRALLLAAIANGRSTIHNLLMGADNLATLTALSQLGVVIKVDKNNIVYVEGQGLHSLVAPQAPLDMANSGTGLRLLTGILAAQPFMSEITGDASLQRRPMQRIVGPLTQMGARIETSAAGTPPLLIKSCGLLQGITYAMPIASAQVKSCLLLAGLYAHGHTTLIEPALSRDHTERMLRQFGYPLTIDANKVSILGGQVLQATNITVPGDISSAAFFMVAASIIKGASLRLRNVGINPTRIGVIKILQLMGADITLENPQLQLAEPIADIIVKYSELQGIIIPQEYIVSALDEFPAIFIAAAFAKGQTELRGARELRVKESDRIQSMATGLTRLGINCEVFDDGICIEGGIVGGGEVDSYGDHRVAMAFAIAGCAATDDIMIHNCANVATSLPNFIYLAQQVGVKIKSL